MLLKRTLERVTTTFDLAVLRSVDFVFFNASNTKMLADMLPMHAFGWATACLDEGATTFATAFYEALDDDVVAAFEQASTAVERKTATIHLNNRQISSPRFILADPLPKRRRLA